MGNEIVLNNKCYNCKGNTDGKTINFKNSCIDKCPDNYDYEKNSNTCLEKVSDVVTIPNCPNFITKNNNQYSCTNECNNFYGFFISSKNLKLCIKCQEENSFIDEIEKKCVNLCKNGYGSDSDDFFTANTNYSSFVCKKCEDLKIKKFDVHGKCFENCPDNYEKMFDKCVIIEEALKNCDGFCLNGGVCKLSNSNPICDCSNTKFIGEKCEINIEIIEYSTEQANLYLKEGKFAELFEILKNIPQIQTINMLQAVYFELSNILDNNLNNKSSYDPNVFKLLDSFKLLSNE